MLYVLTATLCYVTSLATASTTCLGSSCHNKTRKHEVSFCFKLYDWHWNAGGAISRYSSVKCKWEMCYCAIDERRLSALCMRSGRGITARWRLAFFGLVLTSTTLFSDFHQSTFTRFLQRDQVRVSKKKSMHHTDAFWLHFSSHIKIQRLRSGKEYQFGFVGALAVAYDIKTDRNPPSERCEWLF